MFPAAAAILLYPSRASFSIRPFKSPALMHRLALSDRPIPAKHAKILENPREDLARKLHTSGFHEKGIKRKRFAGIHKIEQIKGKTARILYSELRVCFT